MCKILMAYDNTEGLDALLSNKEFKVDIHNKPSQEELTLRFLYKRNCKKRCQRKKINLETF
ncbi:MAG: hypothetical protein LBT58_01110 [Endomicrobium sp.]|nr:hypothetical protein [Endomicrobium sp.]